MEKSSKERQKKLKNTLKIPKTIPIITTTKTTTSKLKVITKHRKEDNEEDKQQQNHHQQQQQQQKRVKYENHEKYQKIFKKSNTETATPAEAAYNVTNEHRKTMEMAKTTKPTAKAKRIQHRKDNNNNSNKNKNNSNYLYYNDAFYETTNIETETATKLLPYIAEIQQQMQQKKQQQQQLQQKQLTLDKALTLQTANTAIRRAYSKFELLSKCSNCATKTYSRRRCTSHTLNSITQQKTQCTMNLQMPLKSSSKFQKLLQFIALSKLKSNRNCSNGISVSNNSCCLDARNFVYVTLCVLIYCTILIHASATATAAVIVATETESAFAPFHSSSSRENLLQQQLAINISQSINVQAEMEKKIETETETETEMSIDIATSEHIVPNISSLQRNLTLFSTATIGNASLNPSLSLVYQNSTNSTTHRLHRRDAANVPDDDDDSSYHDDEFDEYDALVRNKSAKGKYIGAPCNEMKCESTLLHVTCDRETLTCGCEKNYPVQLGLTKGCGKPKKLGEQCFYDVTCMYNDENSLCVQVRHNALCQCASGFHSVSYTKPTRRVFCTQDLKELTSDLPTLLGVTTGIAVLAGLICMVLHLFSKTKYPRHRNFGDANIPPPIMYSSDTGIPLIVQSGRPSSRSSLRSSGSIGSYGNRRSSSGGVIGGGSGSGGSKGILVSTSRTGSRRPSLASVHSTSSSVRSYSMMRFEKETQQKEIRQEMKLRLARLQQQQQMSQNRPQIIIGDALTMLSGRPELGASGSGTAMTAFSRLTMATPSPLTPNSTDELLPVVDESQEYPLKSEMLPMTSTKANAATALVAAATLTAVQEIASTSTMALAAAAAAARSNIAENTAESSNLGSSNDATGIQQELPSKVPVSEAGAYIGPCGTSSDAL